MKKLRTGGALLIAALIFWGLNNSHGRIPPLGKLLNPFAGFWQNGERMDALPEDLVLDGLTGEVRILWDTRRVPYIFADNDTDLYFAQGYVAALLRLWQMEFQVLHIAGRLTEIVGPAALPLDRFHRRFGMLWAAEKMDRAFEDDLQTKQIIDAYAAGVNAYIDELKTKDLPLEYKILDYRPEPWSGVKSALLLMSMSYTLAGGSMDPALTVLREALGEDAVDLLFPYHFPLADPVIPPGTAWDFKPIPIPRIPENVSAPGAVPNPGGVTSASAGQTLRPFGTRPGPGIGSNNWAVSGRLTQSGFPILCNDMHLGLNLPAVWYELQLSAPGVRVRGVSFPGAPTVVAGFNENIAWGFTNAGSDVLDWYAITFRDESRSEYLYGGEWRKTVVREEKIEVRGAKPAVDRVLYTHHGPVVRLQGEPAFDVADVPPDAALRWLGHDPSNLILAFHRFNRADNCDDFMKALELWIHPAQNIVYADAAGQIAIVHSGMFPLRWKGQGRYILDGTDPAHDWAGWIPTEHLPRIKNPERGFVGSANQAPAGPEYPYYLGWNYVSFERGARINEILAESADITPEDMIRMQNDILGLRPRKVLPVLLGFLENEQGSDLEIWCLEKLQGWNFEYRSDYEAPAIFREFWNSLNMLTWDNKKPDGLQRMPHPASDVMIDLILNHPESVFFDDHTTPEKERLPDIARRAFRDAVGKLEERRGPPGDDWQWGRAKGTRIGHLARMPGLGRENLVIDGDATVIRAVGSDWGPSWSMVVEMGPELRAWGIYPGGQSGNPGSRHYEDFIGDWMDGKPYEILFLKSADDVHPQIVKRTALRGTK